MWKIPHTGVKNVDFLKCPESIQTDSRTVRACSGVDLGILAAIFGREIGNFKNMRKKSKHFENTKSEKFQKKLNEKIENIFRVIFDSLY